MNRSNSDNELELKVILNQFLYTIKCKRPQSDISTPVDGRVTKKRRKEEAVAITEKKTRRNRKHTRGSSNIDKRNQKLISDWFSAY